MKIGIKKESKIPPDERVSHFILEYKVISLSKFNKTKSIILLKVFMPISTIDLTYLLKTR